MPAVRHPIEMVSGVRACNGGARGNRCQQRWLVRAVFSRGGLPRARAVRGGPDPCPVVRCGRAECLGAGASGCGRRRWAAAVIPAGAAVLLIFAITGLVANFTDLDQALRPASAAVAPSAACATAPEGEREPAGSRSGAERRPAWRSPGPVRRSHCGQDTGRQPGDASQSTMGAAGWLWVSWWVCSPLRWAGPRVLQPAESRPGPPQRGHRRRRAVAHRGAGRPTRPKVHPSAKGCSSTSKPSPPRRRPGRAERSVRWQVVRPSWAGPAAGTPPATAWLPSAT